MRRPPTGTQDSTSCRFSIRDGLLEYRLSYWLWFPDPQNEASTRQGSRLSKLSRGNSLIHQRSPDALLDAVKVDHFLDCLSSPSFLQDVAYGTRIHKLESGQSLEVPNMVRTVISSHLFLESNFEPLWPSTLFSMIKVWIKFVYDKFWSGQIVVVV